MRQGCDCAGAATPGIGLALALLVLAGLLAVPAAALAQSTDATLSDLELRLAVGDGPLPLNETFAPNTTSYTADSFHYEDTITIDPTLKDDTAGYVIQDGDGNTLTDAYPRLEGDDDDAFQATLAVGANTFKVVVTAEDGNTTKTYTVVVTRAAQATGTAIWSATLTVGGGKGYCDGAGTASACNYGSLSDDDFTLDSTDYVIESIRWGAQGSGTSLHLTLNRIFPAADLSVLALEVNGYSFPLSEADSSAENHYLWYGRPPAIGALSNGTTITVKLIDTSGTMNANNVATGQPGIDGTPQVGQTLTATAGNMADDDGLPTTTFPTGYTFRWVRVVGITETIVGTNSHQYTPVAGDVGRALIVEVSFTDGGNTMETLESDRTGAVVAAQGSCPADGDWCASLTVGTSTIAGTTRYGYTSSIGSLDNVTIDHGGTTYTVSGINIVDAVADTVQVDLDAFLPLGSVFDLGGQQFTADATSETSTTGRYEWTLPSEMSWIVGQKVPVSAYLAPIATRATVDGDRLVLTFADDLDTDFKPAASAFTITVDGGAGAAPSSVDTVSGNAVTMTLASAVTSGQVVTIAYAVPMFYPLRDESGIQAPAFAAGDFTVTNNTPAKVVLLDTTLTVAGSGRHIGCSSTSDFECDDQMAEHTFVSTDAGEVAKTFAIDGLQLSRIEADGLAYYNMHIWFAGIRELRDYEVNHLVLELDDEAFRFRNADAGGYHLRQWRHVGLRWHIGDTIAVRILDFPASEGRSMQAPLTGTVQNAPASHDGTSAFSVRLAFSEDIDIEPTRLRDDALKVSHATVSAAARVNGRGDLWEITLAPTASQAISIQVRGNLACTQAGAICTATGKKLAANVTHSVAYQAPGGRSTQPQATALTAAFENVPEEHDGSGVFTLELAFSEAVFDGGEDFNRNRAIRDAVRVTGGTVRGGSRADPDAYDRWILRIGPAGNGDVTVSLPATTGGCDAAGAICTPDGKALTDPVSATIQGPPALSVADVEVAEGPDAKLEFTITLSRAASGTVTVEAATSDGSAVAGDDYEANSSTKTFAPGQTTKVFEVKVIDDDHDEGSETMTVTLSNPSGGNAYIADGEAVGTITNDDHMPRAWLARFGRTVADQVIDAVEARMGAARAPGTEVSLAGRRVGAPEDGAEAREAEAGLETLAEWLSGAGGEEETSALTSRTVDGRELLGGSSFALTAGSAESGFGSLWGRGAVSRFDGRKGDFSLDGAVASALLGADFTRGRGTAGLVVAHSLGEGGYRSPSGGGEIESTLTGLYPWGRYAASERLSLWGVAGYGSGTLTPEGQAPIETDMELTMAALGGRGVVAEAPPEGGLELSLTTDALVVRTTSEAVRGRGGNLAASEADATRLRLGLEGTWRGLGTLVPTLEVAARHDGGDAETGFGADIGGRLVWSDPALGMQAELAARGLLTHEDGGLSERGFAGSLAWDPSPDSDRGPTLTLRQAVGAEARGGMDALLRPDTARVLEAANDDGPDRRRLEARLGYGIALFGGGWTGVPEFGLGLTEASREYIHAWRLLEARDAGLVFGLDVEGVRNEKLDGDAAPGHRVGLGFGWELAGARREDLALRIEASRLQPANEDPESRIGVRFSARW